MLGVQFIVQVYIFVQFIIQVYLFEGLDVIAGFSPTVTVERVS